MGECFFWYRPTRVVLDQEPLNSCVCVCVTAKLTALFLYCHLLMTRNFFCTISVISDLCFLLFYTILKIFLCPQRDYKIATRFVSVCRVLLNLPLFI